MAANSDLRFYLGANSSTVSGLTERFSISSSGVVDVKEGQFQLSKQGAANFVEIGQGQNANNFAYIDLIGDSTYTDFGLRLLRGSGGANSTDQLVHRGTGALEIIAQDAGSVKISTTNAERMRVNATGMFFYNGVQKFYVGFAIVNNGYYYWDIPVRNEGGSGNVQFVVMGYNHYYSSSYGASRVTMTATRQGNLGEMISLGNQSHSQAGAWSVSKNNASTYRIEKSGGTYTGTGHGFIDFTTRE